jgi:hypothetical protein
MNERDGWLPAVLVLLVTPLAGHVLLSPYGFNPTDDGFFGAISRRLLSGEVPHRDFISLRPVLTPLLHAPEVWLGGERTFLVSRLVVWFELAATAWCWVRLAQRWTGSTERGPVQVALALVVLMLNHGITNHTTWPTTDGILLASAAFLCLSHDGSGAVRLGYLLLGLAPLCKQSFAPLLPITVVALGHGRRVGGWAWALVPAFVYAGAMALAGGVGPLVEQVFARRDIVERGIVAYTSVVPLSSGIACGVLGPWSGALLPLGVITFASTGLANGGFLDTPAFLLFWAAFGATLASGLTGGASRPAWRLGALALGTAWCASLSGGYNTPARAAGILALGLLVSSWPQQRSSDAPTASNAYRIGLLVTLLIVASCYGSGRTRHLYRERPRGELTERLDGVFPGAHGLHTNARTAAVLTDLRAAIDRAPDRLFAILPDFAGYWVAASQHNPLLIDWPNRGELRTPAIWRRFREHLEAQRGRIRLVVQKYSTETLHRGLARLDSRQYPVLAEVRARWRKVDETEFFEIYE